MIIPLKAKNNSQSFSWKFSVLSGRWRGLRSRGVKSSVVSDSAESDSAVPQFGSLTPPETGSLTLPDLIRVSDSLKSYTPRNQIESGLRSNRVLSECKRKFEKYLKNGSEAHLGSVDEKIRGLKVHATVLLTGRPLS
jgi:hypothetical protein